jgi:hypothetical protein
VSLASQVNALATRVGTEIKAIYTALAGKAPTVHTHVATTDLTATGTKDATTFLRGDNTWAAGTASLSGSEYTLSTQYTSNLPATPASGITLYTKTRARRMLAVADTMGYHYTVQNSLASTRTGRMTAVNGVANPDFHGLAVTNVAAPTAVTVATTNLFSSVVRTRYSTTAVAGIGAGFRTSTAQWYQSNNTGVSGGGFYMVVRCGLSAITATNRGFIGMSTTATALNPAVNPSTFQNMFGFGWDSTDTTQMYFMNNLAVATATKTALGTTFAPQTAATNFYEFQLFSPPNAGAVVYWSARKINDGTLVSGVVSTNMPAINTLLAAHVHYSNGTTAAIGSIDVQSFYIESEY